MAAGKVWIQLLKVKGVLSLTCVMAFIFMRLTLQRIGVPVIFCVPNHMAVTEGPLYSYGAEEQLPDYRTGVGPSP